MGDESFELPEQCNTLLAAWGIDLNCVINLRIYCLDVFIYEKVEWPLFCWNFADGVMIIAKDTRSKEVPTFYWVVSR